MYIFLQTRSSQVTTVPTRWYHGSIVFPHTNHTPPPHKSAFINGQVKGGVNPPKWNNLWHLIHVHWWNAIKPILLFKRWKPFLIELCFIRGVFCFCFANILIPTRYQVPVCRYWSVTSIMGHTNCASSSTSKLRSTVKLGYIHCR
jgi:hypothetical protein